MKAWSNLAQVVYKRTYSRKDSGTLEKWNDTVERVLAGNIQGHNVGKKEIERLRYFLLNRKATPAGRGLWFSGAPSHKPLGGVALCNCWGVTADDWMNFVLAQDLLMLGGGVGMSVEHRFVSKLPKVKKGVEIRHKETKDAAFIVPDSREGWCELTRRILEAFFVTGKSVEYSTVCIRGAGEPIRGFGGVASGAIPLNLFVDKLTSILKNREGRSIRPIDAADILCSIGELVVSGNVRRSALLIMGDPFDKDYLKAKRWDLHQIPSQRAMANFSVAVDDTEDLHPLFWKTYEHGEPFGIVNRTNIQKYSRMGELKPDSAVITNPCVPAGTEILTNTGYKKIDELIGQTIGVWNGFEFSMVQPQITGHDQKLVKINLSSGQSLVCTTAHEFVVREGYNDKPYKLKASELTIGTKLEKFLYPVIETGDIVDIKDAYTQGFYSGDGNGGGKTVWLYGEKIKCAARMSGTAGGYYKSTDRTYFGIDFEPKDKSYVPSSWGLLARLEWFAGLLDSDGTEQIEGGTQIASVDKDFLLRTQKMLTTLGVASKVTFSTEAAEKLMPDGKGGKKLYQCKDLWRLLVGALPMQRLRSMGLRCERLILNKDPNRDASRFNTVTSIEDAGIADTVFCFKEGKRGLGCFEGIVTGQCAEATLEDGEPCNLQEISLSNLDGIEEFEESARLMHRWGKRVTCEKYHQEKCDRVVKRNRRIGTGITGCLMSDLFSPENLDRAYAAIQDENVKYSKELGIPESIRTTVVKPSGTMSKLMDMRGYEGIHAAYSRYYIQRVRFSATDLLVPLLISAGHHVEPVVRFDGSLDHGTVVVDFYERAPDGYPVADEDWSTWKQLDVLKMAQKHWADQSVSVTVYYRKEEIPQLKSWLSENLQYLKTISFLCHNDHGFKQAPKEAITAEQYEKLSSEVSPVDVDSIGSGEGVDGMECEGGACPIK